jgi:hypothetical protein
MFIPDVVLPEQFHDALDSASKTRGEIALLHAILEDAVRCFQHRSVVDSQHIQRLAREAEEWLFSDDASWPFSFVNVCAALGLDPEYVRWGLQRQRQRAAPQKKKRAEHDSRGATPAARRRSPAVKR